MTKLIIEKITGKVTKWALFLWHVPAVKGGILSVALKVLIRVGLSSGLAAIVVAIIDALSFTQ
jgi:hypothetical protein